jgi:hypothetical protein
MRRIVRTWWPLAASWMLMSFELPAITAVIARLANPEINLAAYGSIVFPLALIIESPIIMLLSASTAISKDWASYIRLRRFMLLTGTVLTILHVLLAFTPLYYVVVNGILGAPAEIVEPARLSLMIMTPWTLAIAHRRFNQGVLIRFGHSHAVGQGTLLRLAANVAVLAAGYSLGASGAVVGASTATAGVICEAIYIARRVRPVIRDQVRNAPVVNPAMTFGAMMDFYIPLSMTSLISHQSHFSTDRKRCTQSNAGGIALAGRLARDHRPELFCAEYRHRIQRSCRGSAGRTRLSAQPAPVHDYSGRRHNGRADVDRLYSAFRVVVWAGFGAYAGTGGSR